MNTIKKAIFFLLLSVALGSQTQAQLFDDWEARPNVSLKYKINNNWTVSGTYYMYFDKNISRFNKSVISGDVSYKITPWLKAGVDYRYGMKQKGNYNDIRYTLAFKYEPSKKWELTYRPSLQQEFTSLNKDHLVKNPVEYYFRNRLTLGYKLTKKTDIFVFTENYLKAEQGEMNFYRQKSAIGADFEINKRNEISTRMEVINKRNGKMIARPNVSYTYTLGKVKKPK